MFVFPIPPARESVTAQPTPTPRMNRTWWTHLQTIAPEALGACTTRFAKKYPADWRRRIQQLGELDRYFFEMYKLEVHSSRAAGGALPYGFRIAGQQWRVQRARHYPTLEEARWAGLSVAFQLVEADRRRVHAAPPVIHQPLRRQPKDEKKDLAQEDWRRAPAVDLRAHPV